MTHNYSADSYWGTNDEQYLVGAEKLLYPMGPDEANYEVKYIEYKDEYRQTPQHLPSWVDPNWKIINRYKSVDAGGAIAQGKQELLIIGI